MPLSLFEPNTSPAALSFRVTPTISLSLSFSLLSSIYVVVCVWIFRCMWKGTADSSADWADQQDPRESTNKIPYSEEIEFRAGHLNFEQRISHVSFIFYNLYFDISQSNSLSMIDD